MSEKSDPKKVYQKETRKGFVVSYADPDHGGEDMILLKSAVLRKMVGKLKYRAQTSLTPDEIDNYLRNLATSSKQDDLEDIIEASREDRDSLIDHIADFINEKEGNHEEAEFVDVNFLIKKIPKVLSYSDGKEQYSDLISFLMDYWSMQNGDVLTRIDIQKTIDFNEIPFVFRPGVVVLVNHYAGYRNSSKGTKRQRGNAAEIIGISEKFIRNFGRVITLEALYYKARENTLVEVRQTIDIPNFKGMLDIDDDLPMRRMTPDEIKESSERGKVVAELATKPNFMQHQGEIVNTERMMFWKVNRESYHEGRVMIDTLGKQFDSGEEVAEDERTSEDKKNRKIKDSEMCLVYPYLDGYSFERKSWSEFYVDDLSEIQFETDAFRYLVLDESKKELLQTMTKLATRQDQHIVTDFLRNKGQGVVVLLDGPTGNGKTFSAEATAETLKLPLYHIDVAELGLSPGELESNLQRVMKLAHRWRAVLLLDEADVFFEARGTDVERAALVAIFLRILEYFPGILFATTNRVKEFDPAIMGRISLPIHYPELDKEEKTLVWTNLIEFLSKEGANFNISKSELTELIDYCLNFNGREIKNLIRTSYVLSVERGEESVTAEAIKKIAGIRRESARFLSSSKA